LGFGGNNKGSGPIGIAVSAADVRLAQRLHSGQTIFEREALPQGISPSSADFHAQCSRAIATAIRRGAFVGKLTVSALPSEMLRYKTLRLPPMPHEDLTQAIAWEASERFELDDNYMLQHHLAGSVMQGNEQRQEVILLAAEKSAVHDHASAIQRAGLVPTVIDATGAALVRLLFNGNGSMLIVNTEGGHAQVIAARDGRVIFDKPIERSSDKPAQDQTALSRELSLCLRYLSVTFGMHVPDQSWLCGDNTSPQIISAISKAVSTPVLTVGDAPAIKPLLEAKPDAADWSVALGLAMRECENAPQRGAA